VAMRESHAVAEMKSQEGEGTRLPKPSTAKSGWEAGIRTPITCSRGMRPTVGRPPSTDRSASKGTELSIIAHRPVWESGLSSANLFAAHHLFAATCIRRDFARLILL